MSTQKVGPEFLRLPNVAAAKLGAKAIIANNEHFGSKENLLKQGRGQMAFDKNGYSTDAWITRRRRNFEGRDWCIIELAAPTVLHGVEIDTHYFEGNFPPFASVQACLAKPNSSVDYLTSDRLKWTEVLNKVSLQPHAQNFFRLKKEGHFNHLKFNIYPDGGITRFKAYGKITRNWDRWPANKTLDLAAMLNGARAIMGNNMLFGHINNLILPFKSESMSDSWQTRRSRIKDNFDWAIIKLAAAGYIKKIEVDTSHFVENYPYFCSLEGCEEFDRKDIDMDDPKIDWIPILEKVKLQGNNRNIFIDDIIISGKFTHVRLKMYPDGGISRLRLWGEL
ncbi:MAG: allantoicase [Chitinophagales bacterium]